MEYLSQKVQKVVQEDKGMINPAYRTQSWRRPVSLSTTVTGQETKTHEVGVAVGMKVGPHYWALSVRVLKWMEACQSGSCGAGARGLRPVWAT